MGGKSKGHVVTPEETMRLIEQQQVMNNPNVSNRFGTTETTFGADGQAQITQTPSEAINALIDQQEQFAGAGPSQLNLLRDPYSQGMMEQFGNRVNQRMTPPQMMGNDQMVNLGQPPQMPNQMKPPPQMGIPNQQKPPQDPRARQGMSMLDNAPNNGVQVGDGTKKSSFMDRLGGVGKQISGYDDEKKGNSLVQALMNYGRKR